MKYLRYIVQKTPSTGRIHLQGYVQYKSGQQLSDAKKYLGISLQCHCEIQRGTVDQCILYIKDDEKKTNCVRPEYKSDEKSEVKLAEKYYMFEYGTPDMDIMVQQKKQGQRTDLLDIKDLIRSGTSRQEIRDMYPDVFTKYGKTIGEWLSEKQDSFEYKIPADVPWLSNPQDDDTCIAISRYLEEPTDSRTILWIWSVQPKKGKTTYLKWIYNQIMGHDCSTGATIIDSPINYQIVNNINITFTGDLNDGKRLRELCEAVGLSKHELQRGIIRTIANERCLRELNEINPVPKKVFGFLR